MNTVFSYIVQNRFSQEYENIATEALAFILQSDESARAGLMKLLRGIAPGLPNLNFRTQETVGNARPDMWGFDGTVPRVFIENKFWAGLTETQPITYLQHLAKSPRPSVLLVVVPTAREETVWRELHRRLENAKAAASSSDISAGIVRCEETALGPMLALTSWGKLLSAIELAITNEPAEHDLRQLRALCGAADSQAFKPISCTELTDQRTPAFILQLSEIVGKAVGLGVTEGILSIEQLRPQSDFTRMGRYVWVPLKAGGGAWFGTHLELWRDHGETPLWLVFAGSSFGRAVEVRGLLESWCALNSVFSTCYSDQFAMAINLVAREEKEQVVRFVVDQLKRISQILSNLRPIEDKMSNTSAPLPPNLRTFVDNAEWTFARTMPQWPHEYIVRQPVDGNLFEQLARHIQANGFEAAFYQETYVYYEDDGMLYWAMGTATSQGCIINRCRKESSYEFRLRNGTLP